MRESKSRALPLGDTAIFKRCVVFPTVTGLFPVATEGDAVGAGYQIPTGKVFRLMHFKCIVYSVPPIQQIGLIVFPNLYCCLYLLKTFSIILNSLYIVKIQTSQSFMSQNSHFLCNLTNWRNTRNVVIILFGVLL